jgi:hypothetical protein
MSSTSYSFFSSSTTIDDESDWIWSMKESLTAIRNKKMWNVSWIFIDCDKSNWQASFNTFLILYESIHLWFNFLNERSILIFFVNNHIRSSNSYSNENDLFWFACFFWVSWAFANFFFVKSQISFIFLAMIAAFCVSTRSLVDNRSCETSSFEFENRNSFEIQNRNLLWKRTIQ